MNRLPLSPSYDPEPLNSPWIPPAPPEQLSNAMPTRGGAPAVSDVGNADSAATLAAHESGRAPDRPAEANTGPTDLLLNWAQILAALNMKNTKTTRNQVSKLNAEYRGPIIPASRGGQPKAGKSKLLNWWNGLEEQFKQSQQKRADKKASVEGQHPYGRTETVVPEIGGHVKKRRKKRPGDGHVS
jgi:hypothetical protein